MSWADIWEAFQWALYAIWRAAILERWRLGG